MTDYEKYRQICREARGTGILLVLLILFWLAAGFGAYAVWGPAPVAFGLPVWAIGGTIGVWWFAIIGVWVRLHTTFRAMSLDESGEDASAKGGEHDD